MLATTSRLVPRHARTFYRTISTLPKNPAIKVFDNPKSPQSHILSYLDTKPPTEQLAIGTTSQIPPTPQSFTENHEFVKILNQVIQEHGHHDEDLKAQAQAFAGPGGFNLGSGGAFFPRQRNRGGSRKQGGGGGAGGDGAGGASAQGGAGGAGRGGWVHLSDKRNPPDFGRIAWPEDILGSVEVDGQGTIIGKVQPSGTYRIITNEGILGLGPFLEGKLVEKLKQEENKRRS